MRHRRADILPDLCFAHKDADGAVLGDVHERPDLRRRAAVGRRRVFAKSRVGDVGVGIGHKQAFVEDVRRLRQGGWQRRCKRKLRPGVSLQPGSSLLYRVHNARMGAAAAEIVLQRVPDCGLVRIRGRRQQRHRRHDHTGGAIATLEGTGFEKGGLHRVQPPGAGQAFDGGDRFPGQIGGEHAACLNWVAVDEHGAGATFAVAAAVLRSGQRQLLAQHV